MAVNLLEQLSPGPDFRWRPGRIPLPDTRRSRPSDSSGLLDPKQLRWFLFYQARAEQRQCVRDGARVQPSVVMPAACGKQVALGQKTASAAYAVHTTGAGPAASGLAGSLAVYVAGARSGDPAPPTDVASAARESECCGRLAVRADARLFPVLSAHAAS